MDRDGDRSAGFAALAGFPSDIVPNVGVATPDVWPSGRKVVDEHRPCHDVFIVHDGWLAAFRQLADGGRQILNFWLPGDVGGIELLACRTAPFSVCTITPCRISRLRRSTLLKACEGDELVRTALAATCRNSLMLREHLVSLGRRTAFASIAHLLLELAMRSDGGIAREQSALLPLTQVEIADATGLTAAYVGRQCGIMRERGFLTHDRSGLQLHNIQKLMRMVQFDPDYRALCRATPAAASLFAALA